MATFHESQNLFMKNHLATQYDFTWLVNIEASFGASMQFLIFEKQEKGNLFTNMLIL